MAKRSTPKAPRRTPPSGPWSSRRRSSASALLVEAEETLKKAQERGERAFIQPPRSAWRGKDPF
jgi:hypothetical protein